MARVCLFHWNTEEARPLLTVLQAAGHSVDFYGQMASFRTVRERPPEAIVIDLSRLPSHGRELALFFRGSKATRHVPIVFVDGEAEKIERVRKLLPDAVYTPASRLRSALRSALKRPPVNPVKPAQMMDRWGDRTTAQKLGIAKGSRVGVIDAPWGYAQAVGDLPEGAFFEEDARDCPVSLWFVHGVPEFQAALPGMRRVAAHSRLWIVWRKNKRDGLDGNLIRSGCIEVGLVDYKICSLNDTWSGMVFAVKKSSTLPAAKPGRRGRRTRSPAGDS